MKTARFKDVVARVGRPELHLTWSAPASDKVLQAVAKQHRVLTVYQQTRGSKKDHAVVGLEIAPHAQYLVFPKSLRPFADHRIVGIQYDLLKNELSSGGKLPPARSHPKEASEKVVQFASFERPPNASKTGPSIAEPTPTKSPEPEEKDPVRREIKAVIADLKAGHAQKARKRLEALLET